MLHFHWTILFAIFRTCLLVSSVLLSVPLFSLCWFFLSRLAFEALMGTCAKFNLNYFWVTTTSVLIIQLSAIRYERSFALRFRVLDESRATPPVRGLMAAILNNSSCNGLMVFLYHSLRLFLYLVYTWCDWKDEGTRSSSSSWKSIPESHSLLAVAPLHFTTAYGARSSCTVTGSEFVSRGSEAGYFLWRHQSAVNSAPKYFLTSKFKPFKSAFRK
jgi:hypothetical protein